MMIVGIVAVCVALSSSHTADESAQRRTRYRTWVASGVSITWMISSSI